MSTPDRPFGSVCVALHHYFRHDQKKWSRREGRCSQRGEEEWRREGGKGRKGEGSFPCGVAVGLTEDRTGVSRYGVRLVFSRGQEGSRHPPRPPAPPAIWNLSAASCAAAAVS